MLSVLVLLMLAGCGCEHEGESYRAGAVRPASCNTCTCELGGSGVALCHWRITLSADRFGWDVSEEGTWWCDDARVQASSDSDGRLEVLWVEDTQQLEWQGVVYEREP